MRITIIGGHGQIALLTAPKLASSGHAVTAVIRDAAQIEDVEKTGATALVFDIEHQDQDAIGELLSASDAVIWAAGAGGGNPERTRAVDQDAAIRTIDAAVAAGIKRFVMVSYMGSRRDDVPTDNPFHHYAQAKAAADQHLIESSLNWSILGPSRLTFGKESQHILYGDQIDGGDTSRANVAEMLYRVVGRMDLGGAIINFRDGDVSINDAIGTIARQRAGAPVSRLREGKRRAVAARANG